MNTYERPWQWRYEDKTLALTEDEKKALLLPNDITNRRGFRRIWEEVNEIPRNEILEKWLQIVRDKKA